MNEIQNIIDRQLGLYSRFNYDYVLKRLVVSGEESFYGLQNNTEIATLEQDPPIFACRFSEASGYEHILALANEDGKVAIQNTATAATARSLEAFQCHNNAVFDLAWMPGHMNFVTVSGDHTACLWDVGESNLRKVLVFSNHTRSVKTAVFRPNESSVFATGARDGHILIWDVRTRNQPCVVLKPDNSLMNCHSCFTPKTPGSSSKRTRLDNHRATSITGLVFQDDLTLISCGECDGNIKAWDLRKNYNTFKREPLPKHSIPYCGSSTKNGYTNLIIDESRVKLYASCMDNVIYCFNISTYNNVPEHRYIGHENSTFYIKTSLSPDCNYLVSGSSDKNAYIWNVKYSQPVVKLVGHWAEVTCAVWCQKGDMKIVTCSDDARHKIWKVGREFPEEPRELKGSAEVVPNVNISLPLWGALEKTPRSHKRKLMTTPSSTSVKRMKTQETVTRRTKRCLSDLMNTCKNNEEIEVEIKRQKMDSSSSIKIQNDECLLTTGVKRHTPNIEKTPNKQEFLDFETTVPSDWNYICPKPGEGFMTPTKNYERKTCKIFSPKSPKFCTSHSRSPVKVSPSKVRIISFSTPTKNLPNFVMDGQAPHLRLMSPEKKKPDITNWLTLMTREKKCKSTETVIRSSVMSPETPKVINSSITPKSSSIDKTQKTSAKKSRTLLKYFNVSDKRS